MDSQKLANVRTAVYTLAAGIGGFFVARGIITQAQLDSYLPIVVTVVGLILAIVNVAPGKPVTEPQLARLEDSTARVEDSIAQLTDAPAPAADPAPQVTPGDHADPAAANELLAKLDELSKQ